MPRKSTSVRRVSLPKSLLKEARMIVKNKWNLLETIPDGMNYCLQEKIIENLFLHKAPGNTDIRDVWTKASLLNIMYSTVVYAIPSVAREIVAIPNFDKRLVAGEHSLVPLIAKAGHSKWTYRSFATKYCACHQPNLFPIYDSIVRDFLINVISAGHLAGYADTKKSSLSKIDRDYLYYKKVYDDFMTQYHLTSLTYRQVDWYIWVAHKCKKTAKLHSLNLFKIIK